MPISGHDVDMFICWSLRWPYHAKVMKTLDPLICCHIALFINILLPMLLPGSVVNMFYLGPERSSLIVFDKIYDKYDWVVQYKSYEMALTIGAFIFFLPHLIVGRVRRRRQDKAK